MTDILFGYDHLLIRAAYRTPDLHRHLLCHLIVSMQGDVTCMADGDKFTASGLFIGSDVEHTVYTERGELLLFLFDKTSDFVRQIEKNYLKGKSYVVMELGQDQTDGFAGERRSEKAGSGAARSLRNRSGKRGSHG